MNTFIRRVYIVYFILIILAIRIISRVIFLLFVADIEVKDIDISFRQEEIEATRGSILARDGRALSTSVPYFQIRMDCALASDELFNSQINALAKELSVFFGNKSPALYKKELIEARKAGKRYKTIGNRIVDYTEMLLIKQFPIFKEGSLRGGLITEQKSRRNNPYGRLAYRTIGYINSNEVGVGVERSYDFYLKGKPGKQIVQRMLGGEWVPVASQETILPQDGYDILTTIDIDIQEATEIALKEQLSLSEEFEGATAIVMEVSTGAIRAVANMKKEPGGTFDESYNYAIGHATEPGSTFKLATLVALIEDGYISLDTPVDAGDGKWKYSSATYHDVSYNGYGKINMLEAFEKSSNVAFAKMAVEHYANNEKKFVDRIMNMKITEKFNLDIMGEAQAVIYAPGDKMWSKVSLPSMAIGYSSMITPLHTLTFYNAIANRGKMMKPYFIENIQKNNIIHQKFGPQEVSGSICSQRTAELVQKALRGVVVEGTGKIIDDPRYNISGKTGTARVAFDGKYVDAAGYRKHQATFAGFFPSENPKYSAIVVLYSVKTRANFYGGSWAAPVFKKISDKIYSNSPEWKDPLNSVKEGGAGQAELLAGNTAALKTALSFLPSQKDQIAISEEWAQKDSTGKRLIAGNIQKGTVPNVLGMGLRDALYLLENKGYRVSFKGKGRVVSQSPEANRQMNKNGIVEIELSSNYDIK
ncbi:MAG: penicillin-binding protein [Bacteroidales bacterium]